MHENARFRRFIDDTNERGIINGCMRLFIYPKHANHQAMRFFLATYSSFHPLQNVANIFIILNTLHHFATYDTSDW